MNIITICPNCESTLTKQKWRIEISGDLETRFVCYSEKCRFCYFINGKGNLLYLTYYVIVNDTMYFFEIDKGDDAIDVNIVFPKNKKLFTIDYCMFPEEIDYKSLVLFSARILNLQSYS